MITDYVEAAMRHAKYETLEEDGVYYAEIPELPGVWASTNERDDLEAELREALEGWIALGLRLNHPIPEIDGVRIDVELVQ